VKTCVIILFHGSRAEGAAEAVRDIIAEVRQRNVTDMVAEAFLQQGKPGLLEVVQGCVKQHAGKIVIVPFFLQMGTHVTSDVPAVVKEAKRLYPHVEILLTKAVGAHPGMADIVIDLVREV
jgi:sirohydrochlorin ferrochelatase